MVQMLMDVDSCYLTNTSHIVQAYDKKKNKLKYSLHIKNDGKEIGTLYGLKIVIRYNYFSFF